ncbi:hypothetical protein OFM35_33365, partial [Escherichia coli]|nr:hypothetical protein [Escherichia coli]
QELTKKEDNDGGSRMVTEVKTLNGIVPSFSKSEPAPLSSRVWTAWSKTGTEGIMMDPELRVPVRSVCLSGPSSNLVPPT